MKIALYHNLPSGGAKRHAFGQVRELARRGHDIVEFAPSTADLNYCSLSPHIGARRVFDFIAVRQTRGRIPFLTPYLHALQGVATLRRMDQLTREIAREIDAGDFDVVIAKDCQFTANPYILQYLQTPSVFQCHHVLRQRMDRSFGSEPPGHGLSSAFRKAKDLYYGPARWMFDRAMYKGEVRSARAAPVVLTNSEFSKQALSAYYGINPHVVYPGIDTSVFCPKLLPKEEYVLCVGAMTYNKGYRFLISALGHINVMHRPKLLAAANSIDASEARLVREMASKVGVELEIMQVFNDEEMSHLYGRAKVFVYAPMKEALGLAPLEAMACGTPVVAVAEGGVRETVPDGVAGWLVRRDPDEFAGKLESLMCDRDMRLRMGQAGVEYVRSNWTWQRAVDTLEGHLRGLAKAWPSGRGTLNAASPSTRGVE